MAFPSVHDCQTRNIPEVMLVSKVCATKLLVYNLEEMFRKLWMPYSLFENSSYEGE